MVTTKGHLTESLWRESGAVLLVPIGDTSAIAASIKSLLDNPGARQMLGAAAKVLYDKQFDIRNSIATLLAPTDINPQ
jgi:glycosyltransferase involved in cell wall biosynthesis